MRFEVHAVDQSVTIGCGHNFGVAYLVFLKFLDQLSANSERNPACSVEISQITVYVIATLNWYCAHTILETFSQHLCHIFRNVLKLPNSLV